MRCVVSRHMTFLAACGVCENRGPLLVLLNVTPRSRPRARRNPERHLDCGPRCLVGAFDLTHDWPVMRRRLRTSSDRLPGDKRFRSWSCKASQSGPQPNSGSGGLLRWSASPRLQTASPMHVEKVAARASRSSDHPSPQPQDFAEEHRRSF